MLQQIKKNTPVLMAMLLCAMPGLAQTGNNEPVEAAFNANWLLIIAGILLGFYKIYKHGNTKMKPSSFRLPQSGNLKN